MKKIAVSFLVLTILVVVFIGAIVVTGILLEDKLIAKVIIQLNNRLDAKINV